MNEIRPVSDFDVVIEAIHKVIGDRFNPPSSRSAIVEGLRRTSRFGE